MKEIIDALNQFAAKAQKNGHLQVKKAVDNIVINLKTLPSDVNQATVDYLQYAAQYLAQRYPLLISGQLSEAKFVAEIKQMEEALQETYLLVLRFEKLCKEKSAELSPIKQKQLAAFIEQNKTQREKLKIDGQLSLREVQSLNKKFAHQIRNLFAEKVKKDQANIPKPTIPEQRKPKMNQGLFSILGNLFGLLGADRQSPNFERQKQEFVSGISQGVMGFFSKLLQGILMRNKDADVLKSPAAVKQKNINKPKKPVLTPAVKKVSQPSPAPKKPGLLIKPAVKKPKPIIAASSVKPALPKKPAGPIANAFALAKGLAKLKPVKPKPPKRDRKKQFLARANGILTAVRRHHPRRLKA